jgi:hypothetical protein
VYDGLKQQYEWMRTMYSGLNANDANAGSGVLKILTGLTAVSPFFMG